jgi:hypothetical protein
MSLGSLDGATAQRSGGTAALAQRADSEHDDTGGRHPGTGDDDRVEPQVSAVDAGAAPAHAHPMWG